MAEKKFPGRFTVQFNMEDPQQRQAALFLERQGRRKAQMITNALLSYQSCDKATSAQASNEDDTLESWFRKMVRKALGAEKDTETYQPPVNVESEVAASKNEVDYSAIERTMMAFDQQ